MAIITSYDKIQHENNIRNVCGTFAIEGITISKSTKKNLDRIGMGKVSYKQVLDELQKKYKKN